MKKLHMILLKLWLGHVW